jgi:hypothetical protein
MTTKQALIAAIQAADERVRGLAPLIREQPDAPLLHGEWRVRDALSHVASRADVVMVFEGFTRLAATGNASASAIFDIDAINRGQIQERQERDTEALLQEIAAGHAAALASVAAMDEAALAREIPMPVSSEATTTGNLLLLAGPTHEEMHLDEIARALGVAPD